jgi:hypothetical protein
MAGDIGYILAIDGFVYVHSGILFSGNAQLELEKLKAQAENAAISRKKSQKPPLFLCPIKLKP